MARGRGRGAAVGLGESRWKLSREGAWIASLRTAATNHAVIVSKIEGDLVYLFDPWGLAGPGSGMGTSATMKLGDFIDHWKPALQLVVRVPRKP